MKLNEWNELIEYGNKLCDKLRESGYNVKLKQYTVYDGRKGLAMQVYDSFGLFEEYCTGIYPYSVMRDNLYYNMMRIISEC